jgi:hypothetical protein
VRDTLSFETGKMPTYSEAEFRALENKLNQTYQRFMAARPCKA